MTAAALREMALRHNWSTDFLSLNDPRGEHSLEAADHEIPFSGFGRGKFRFLLSGLSRTRPLTTETTSIVLAFHPNLAVVSRWMQRICPRVQTVVMTHGVEVWKPLTSPRRQCTSTGKRYPRSQQRRTAQKLIEVQGVPPEKIRRLPWPPRTREFSDWADAPTRLPLCLQGSRSERGSSLSVGRWAASRTI